MQSPLTLVFFGVTGDLYQKKLSSALFNLFSLGLLPDNFSVIGFARKPLTDSQFQNITKEAVLSRLRRATAGQKKNEKETLEKLENFLEHLKYVQGNLENPEDFKNLSVLLAQNDKRKGVSKVISENKIFYLATPPNLYKTILKNISEAGLVSPRLRVLIEKPFGKDMEDAENLDLMLRELFDESQIFRVDHYLAKKGLQDFLSFRFEEGGLEASWNNKYIEKVRIIFHEDNVVGTRGPFYDGLGALLDVGQNHMLQMLALVTMHNPGVMTGEKIRDARAEVLEKTVLFPGSGIVRGQYEGYLEEPGVKPNSPTETFFRLGLAVDDERWERVPFELEAGKGLNEAEVFIEVYFKELKEHRERKIFPISPEKEEVYGAYEKVLHDCILGDQTIFTHTKEIMAEWKIVTDIMQAWQSVPLTIYKKGASGESIK